MTAAPAFLSVLSVVVVAIVAVWVHRRFMPLVELRVTPRWDSKVPDVLIVTLEVENKSLLMVSRLESKFQILEHPLPTSPGFMPDFVPFEEAQLKHIPKEWQPLQWHEPFDAVAAKKLEPREIVRTEVLYRCPNRVALHYGLQFKYGLVTRWSQLIYKRESDRCTVSAWAIGAGSREDRTGEA
jgi:hypothetical protein